MTKGNQIVRAASVLSVQTEGSQIVHGASVLSVDD